MYYEIIPEETFKSIVYHSILCLNAVVLFDSKRRISIDLPINPIEFTSIRR